MSNYYDKRDAKVRIAHELMNRGWKVEGYSPDESDSMTDYYSPAHWSGIATKNGYVLVVDNRYNAESKEITRYNPKGNLSIDDREKITKLEAMTVERGCTEGEEENAKKLIEKIQLKVSNEPAYEVVGMTTAHIGNPKGSIWHIEKDGKIYDKGNGLTKFSDIPDNWEFDLNKMEYKAGHDKWFGGEKKTITEEQRKAINDFKSLILRFERVASGINPMGDGTAETEKAGIEQQEKAGFELKTITETKTYMKMVEVTDRKYIQVGDYIKTAYHCCYWKITDGYMRTGTWKGIKEEKKAFTYEQVGKESRGFQSLKNPQRYYDYEFRMLKDIENGNTKIYELKEVTEAIQVEKWVKIDKTQKTYNTNTEAKKEEKEEQQTTEKANINYELTITADIDTRDNTPLWVVKIVDKLNNEEYKKVSDQFKALKGYYSKFKHGFIFKYDPTSILKPEAEVEQTAETITETENNYNDTAENIIDMSTEIITDLNINGSTICNNEEYKTRLYDYITDNNINITDDILTYLKSENAYNNLIEVLELIQSGYYQPIKSGFMYDCHFKEWSIPMQEIKEAITALNISYIEMGDKIGFAGLTAEQAKQVKEISDINGSIFFIDAEMSEEEYNSIDLKMQESANNSTTEEQKEDITEAQEQEEETETNNVIDFEEYKNNIDNEDKAEKMEINNNSNDFNFDDIMNQFDNIEISNNSRISAEDEEFCTKQESQYKQYIKYTNNYIQYLKENSFSNIFLDSDSLIKEMNEKRENNKNWFITKLVNYFKDKYKVTLTSDTITKKYSIEVDYNMILTEIIDQLGGYNFTDKAEKELKDEFKNTIRHDKVIVKNSKISIENFFYIDSWDLKYKTYKVHYNSDKNFNKLFKAFSHFLYRSAESYFDKLYDIITSKQNDDVFKTHEIANNGIKTLKLYKNGKIDIEFSTSEYSRKFAKEYCGYMEKSA